MSQQPPNLEQTVRTLQIITLAMVTGVLLFAGIVVFLQLTQDAGPNAATGVIISTLGAGFAVAAFVMHLVVPSLIARQQARSASDEQLYEVFQSKTIIGLALLEGAAFFNLVAGMVEQQWWSLAVAGGLVFWMLTMFPTQTRVAQWVETQQMLRQETT